MPPMYRFNVGGWVQNAELAFLTQYTLYIDLRGGGGESIDLSVRRIFLSKCIQLTLPGATQVELGPLRAHSYLRVRSLILCSNAAKKGVNSFFMQFLLNC